MEKKAISLIYRDLPNDKTIKAQGWDEPAWFDLSVKGQLRVRPQTIPGMFDFPDVIISHHDFVLLYRPTDLHKHPQRYLVMLTIFTEHPLTYQEKERLQKEAVTQIGEWFDAQPA